MNDNPAHQVFSDLLGYLELLEAQTGAILQFLKEKGIATDEQLAPYLERAANAASVKWGAARVRMEHLFTLSQQVTAEPASKRVSAESPAKPEAARNEDTKESKASKESTKARPGASKEPAKKTEAQTGARNGQPTKDVAAKNPTEPSSSSQDQTSRESERSEAEKQKAS